MLTVGRPHRQRGAVPDIVGARVLIKWEEEKGMCDVCPTDLVDLVTQIRSASASRSEVDCSHVIDKILRGRKIVIVRIYRFIL